MSARATGCWLFAGPALLLVLLAGGCTLLNAPERNLLPPDGGVKGGIELFCDDGFDDDNDTEVDCDDSDCAQEPACCEERRTTLNEDWAAADLRDDWVFTPTTGELWAPVRPSFGGITFVGGFLPDDSPRALLSKDCVSLALGGWVNATLRTADASGCNASEECERYAGVVLTVASDSMPGNKLQDELAVTLHGGGLVLVTQADVEVARATAGVDRDVEVEIEVRSKLDDDNQAVLKAEVMVDGAVVLEDFTVAAIADLLTEGDCSEIPGVRVAAQGRGSDVYVGPVQTAKQDCANPSQFDEQSATLNAVSLEFTPSWVSAYVGSPALASSRNSISDVQWDLMVDGSNDPPELEPSTHIGYAIGHARVDTDEGGDWRLDSWESSESPKVGDDPPSCVEGGPCPDNRSAREPHLLAELNEEQELRDLVFSFAREVVDDPSERDLFGIQIVRPVGSPASSITLSGTPTLSPGEVPGCISLRDPALIPVDSDAQNGYWLLFTCIQDASAPTEIRAVRISRALEVVREGAAPMQRLVLRASELGPFAAAGIRSPEPLISFEADGMRLRIWFLAQAVPGEWAVALAEARTHDIEALEFDLPEPIPFPLNPILSNESTLVRSGCIGGECNITGLAVTPRADEPDRLRFILARRLYLTGVPPTDQLIPLEQTWGKP
jgi:hypothetical protein